MNTPSKPPAHKTPPEDVKAALQQADLLAFWRALTPLAKGEWICWVTSAKKEETRAKRIRVAIDKMKKGDRRPCCWPGCPHR